MVWTLNQVSTKPPQRADSVYTIFIANEASPLTKNLHIDHPEDTILTGDFSVLDWFSAPSDISVKMDGSVAIVWGTNPENGRFFVGKKSVFNKVKVQICYTPQDITDFYGEKEELVDILLSCLDFLPRTEGIYQGDFIGFGGESVYTPNTITYDFGETVAQPIIIAPHTTYTGDTIKGSVAEPLTEALESDDNVLFVQPTVDCSYRFQKEVEEVRSIFDKAVPMTDKAAAEAKIAINAFIREGKELTAPLLELIVGDIVLAHSYILTIRLKEMMMACMITYGDGPTCSIAGQPATDEGYVRSNQFGSFKLVDRYEFSRANFTNGRFQSAS